MKGFYVMSRKIRINRGALLFILLIIGIITYLVMLSFVRSKDEADIKALCSSYVSVETDLNMLPEKYRDGSYKISAEELDARIKDMKDAIKLYYIDNEKAYNYLVKNLEASLTLQAGGGNIIKSYSKVIVDYDDFIYRDNYVEVNFTTETVREDILNGEETSKSFLIDDTLIVQKVDGKWKVVYSSLNNGDYFLY